MYSSDCRDGIPVVGKNVAEVGDPEVGPGVGFGVGCRLPYLFRFLLNIYKKKQKKKMVFLLSFFRRKEQAIKC